MGDVKAMANAVQDSIRGCCKQLKVKLVRISAAKERQQRKRNLTRYIPDVVNALHTVLGTLSEGAKESDEGGVVAAKRRRMLADCTVVRRDCGDHEEDLAAAGTFAVLEGSAAQVDESLMSMVKNNRISKEALVDALTAHVNASDDVDDDGAGGAGTTSAGGGADATRAEELWLTPYGAMDATGSILDNHRALDDGRRTATILSHQFRFQPLVPL